MTSRGIGDVRRALGQPRSWIDQTFAKAAPPLPDARGDALLGFVCDRVRQWESQVATEAAEYRDQALGPAMVRYALDIRRLCAALRLILVWDRADELAAVNTKVQSLRDQWLAGGISDDFFYPTLQRLEQQRRELRNDEARHAASQLRAQSDLSDIRRRWYTNELDLSQKRALVKEALHAVIVHPVGPGGRGRAAFNPNLLELVWRS